MKMKDYSEQRVVMALSLLKQTLEQNVKDTGEILDEYESTHDDYELSISKQYGALNTAHFAMIELINRINNQLNKWDYDL